MLDNSWVFDLEEKIFSILKAKTKQTIKTKYPDVFFTMTDATLTQPKFPTIYVHYLTSQERGQDLEAVDINAVLVGVQIDVTVSASQDIQAARWVNGVLTNAMKSMHFSAEKIPEFQSSTTDTRQTTSRFSRLVGQGDDILG